jgi:hypothetical protein
LSKPKTQGLSQGLSQVTNKKAIEKQKSEPNTRKIGLYIDNLK